MTTSVTAFVDTHCHLDFESFNGDRDEVINRAGQAGVTHVIVPSVDLDNIPAVLDLASRYTAVYAAVGVHPNSTLGWQDDWIDVIRQSAEHDKVKAIGEIGLDYYWDKSPATTQQASLTRQLELAGELDLPVIIHNRDASRDVIRLLAASPLAGSERPGVLHSFSADWTTAVAALEMGFYLGFTGPLTYKKADELREIAARAPLDRILIETDGPFLAPHPHRGRRNEPAYVLAIAERLAELRGESLETIGRVTSENAERLFHLPAQDLQAH